MMEAPNSHEAEQIVLGAVMVDAAVLPEIEEELGQDPAVFYRPAHETIWRAILELVAGGIPPSPIVLADTLDKPGDLKRVGGASYPHTLYGAQERPAPGRTTQGSCANTRVGGRSPKSAPD
ncbi:DnaB-like helicase N-terminal domain-containing protein [Streptomyces sp. NPDC002446]